MPATDYLKRPYGRLVVPDSDGTFVAEIFEFPGCYAVGDTAADALTKLDDVVVDWIDAALAQGQEIPEPMENVEYSGKTVLRMSKGLHKRAAQCAEREGVSLNSFLVNCVAEQVGMRSSVLVVHPQPQPVVYTLNVNMTAMSAPQSISPYGQMTSLTDGRSWSPNQRRREVAHA